MKLPDNRPRRKAARIGVAAAAILALLAGGAAVLDRSADGIKPQAAVVAPDAGNSLNAARSNGDEVAAEAAAPMSAMAPRETRTAMIDRLVASGQAADAQAAFRVIEACVKARLIERQAAKETEDAVKALYQRSFPAATQVCEGVLAGHVTQRVPLALRAAQAGLARSYVDLWALGAQDPFVQNDPAYAAAFPSIRDAAVQRADPDALMGRYAYLSNCSDPPRCSTVDLPEALKLWTAFVEVGGLKHSRDTVTPRLSDALGPEQAAIAISNGHALVAAAKGAR